MGAGKRNVNFRGRGGVWVVVLKIDQMLMYKVAVAALSEYKRWRMSLSFPGAGDEKQ